MASARILCSALRASLIDCFQLLLRGTSAAQGGGGAIVTVLKSKGCSLHAVFMTVESAPGFATCGQITCRSGSPCQMPPNRKHIINGTARSMQGLVNQRDSRCQHAVLPCLHSSNVRSSFEVSLKTFTIVLGFRQYRLHRRATLRST
jgi:hypothetical protein